MTALSRLGTDSRGGLRQSKRSAQTFQEAVCDHEEWREAFERGVRNGGRDMEVETVRAHELCPLHPWLVAVSSEVVTNPAASEMLHAVHAEFHSAAAKVLSAAHKGLVPEAVAAMDPNAQYGRWSGTLAAALRRYAELAAERTPTA